MKKTTFIKLALFILLIFSFISCGQVSNLNTTGQVTAIKTNNSKIIKGTAKFPEQKKSNSPSTSLLKIEGSKIGTLSTKSVSNKFKTKANLTDVAALGTISIIYPPDYSNTALRNVTIATGLTDANGSFALNPSGSFNPSANEIFILEATKRIGDVGNNIMGIRTYIKWDGSTWVSMTIPGIYINSETTALALINSLNPSSLSSSAAIGQLVISSDTGTVVQDIGSLTTATIKKVANLVDGAIKNNRDPFTAIKYINNEYVMDITEQINKLIHSGGCPGCSLENADLTNVDLAGKDLSYTDLNGIDLSTKDLTGTILIGANLSGATLPSDLSYMNLEEANLSGKNLVNSNLEGTNFHSADLSNTILTGKDLTKTRISAARLDAADMIGANLNKVYLFETTFKDTKLTGTDLTKADLTAVDLSGVHNKDLSGVNFTNSNLVGASFKGMNVSNLDLTTANLNGADFSNATITNKRLGNTLQNCNFSNAIIDDTGTSNFGNIDFTGSNFENAKIKNVNFNNINCSNCDFSEAQLNTVTFADSNLESISFDKVSLLTSFAINNSNLRKSSFRNTTTDISNFTNINATDLSYAEVYNTFLGNFSFSTPKADYAKFENSAIGTFSCSTSKLVNLHENGLPEHSELLKSHTINVWYNVYSPIYNVVYSSAHSSEGTYSKINHDKLYLFDPDLLLAPKIYDKIIVKATTGAGITAADQIYYEGNTDATITQSEADSLLTKFDNASNLSSTNVSFKNSFLGEVSGYFINSDFSNSGGIGTFWGYCKYCKFDNSHIYDFKGVSINSTFLNSTIEFSTNSYFKNSSFSIAKINNSFLVNSTINLTSNNPANPSNFFRINSNSGGLPCNKTFNRSNEGIFGEYYYYNVYFQHFLTESVDFYYDWCSSNNSMPNLSQWYN